MDIYKSLKEAEKVFNKAVAERDDFIAKGLESYPVRLYKIKHKIKTVFGYGSYEKFYIGGYDNVEQDKNHYRSAWLDTLKLIRRCGKDVRSNGLEFKVIREA